MSTAVGGWMAFGVRMRCGVGLRDGEVKVVLPPPASECNVEMLAAQLIAADDMAGVGGDALAVSMVAA